MLAVGRVESDFAVAFAQVIAFAIGTAFMRTAGLDDGRNGNTFLIDAHLPKPENVKNKEEKNEKRLLKN